MSDGVARFKDFTDAGEAASFKLRDETFYLVEDVSIRHVRKLASMSKAMEAAETDDAYMQVYKDAFAPLLQSESHARFCAALDGDGPVVVGLKKATEILMWLLEVYGLRPTGQSSS